ncbi:SDR family NAD(P)-dependent oxidoreductase [Jannaschia aquimarina]|uniref:CsgA_1 protein n=1 Tax=Jannaschia aquimarina TaxID=935700 RepID=A0A0D1EEV7_9RHOB|nr:SDR family NAD(P)-dependent oxidoreductase [Jannaschia aquimarina]KIT14420.1 C-factor [Jannaschia aquimarina]SNT29630.1 Short-chain dehydrogenase [Jannaschia aquimarina]
MRALVTGASRGIGAGLLDEGRARGHDVLGTARDGELALDVTDASAQARIAAQVGAIDLLICNAGVYLDKGVELEDLSIEMLTETFAVNVTGVIQTVQAQLANLSKGGRIAIIASAMGSQDRASGNAFAYRASKAAAVNVARNLAAALAPRGIAVGAYHPGWVRTDMGGSAADVSVEQSARGLWDRFEALSPASSGCFETWDGQPVPF